MVRLISEKNAGKSVFTSVGEIRFNSDGIFEGDDSYSFLGEIFEIERLGESREKSGENEVAALDSIDGLRVVKPTAQETISKVSDMTVTQMRKYAKENGIDLSGLTKRDEILSSITEFILQDDKE